MPVMWARWGYLDWMLVQEGELLTSPSSSSDDYTREIIWEAFSVVHNPLICCELLQKQPHSSLYSQCLPKGIVGAQQICIAEQRFCRPAY